MSGNLITAEQAARLLGVKPVTIRSYVARGILTGQKIGRDWIFTKGAIDHLRDNPPKRTGRPPKG